MAQGSALPEITLSTSSEAIPHQEDLTIFIDSQSHVSGLDADTFADYFQKHNVSSWSDLARLKTCDGTTLTGRVTLTETLYAGLLSLSFRVKHRSDSSKEKASSPSYLFQTEQYVEAIARYILPQGDNRLRLDGAIVIAGATSCGKTRIAESLIKRLLLHHQDSRTPHVVTLEKGFEGPITEAHWTGNDNIIPPPQGSKSKLEARFPKETKTLDINYTPRQIPRSCKDLKDGLTDALRQTPAIVYLGELRDDEDMLQMDRFSGTGHLVLATIHAGSLQEAILRYIRAAKEKHFAANSNESITQIASRLRAVIHLEKHSEQESDHCTDATFVSMWYRQGPSSAKAIRCLVETGVPLPYACDDNGTIGRYGFFRALRQIAPIETDKATNSPTDSIFDTFEQAALLRDLENGI